MYYAFIQTKPDARGVAHRYDRVSVFQDGGTLHLSYIAGGKHVTESLASNHVETMRKYVD